jgi:hypothetical protein
MKKYLVGIYRSFPVQLVLLHFKKFQVLLIFWYILFSTISGGFMHSYGADSLLLAPEYRGEVSMISTMIMGIAIGIFVMSWNITTFILFSRHFRFLATTSNPFLKYCINNSILPLSFLIFYMVHAIRFEHYRELISGWIIFLHIIGFILGYTLLILISFIYFFRADKSIIRQLAPVLSDPKLFQSTFQGRKGPLTESRLIKVEWYLNNIFEIKKPRDVKHYPLSFVDAVFSRHHFAAVISIFIAFLFLILVGFNLDSPVFQLPAAAGIVLFFSILIAVAGAFSYFMQSWSLPFFVVLIIILNMLFRTGIMDPSNKAYGLNYKNRDERPIYDKASLDSLSSRVYVEKDIENMTRILEKWKAKQKQEKPILYLVNTSGGGNRSANFTMNVLQRLDSITNGKFMDKVFLITGASGGMLGASYYRELARAGDKVQRMDPKYVDDISEDLLNSVFTSFVARDLAAPAQKFTVGEYEYIKDRGYAFEQKLDRNTHGFLNKRLIDIEPDERNAKVPLMFFNSVITRDGRKMIISTQPVRFLMRPYNDTSSTLDSDLDAVDFNSLFRKQDPLNLRILTAMRMNATFPYVLPNVWLPTKPVIDVMDAGLRDNYGPETAIRFLQVFRKWIRENTSGVVLVQIRDRKIGGWEYPYTSDNITEIFTKPFLLLQYNWYKMQEYNHNDLLSLTEEAFGPSFRRISFEYVPKKEDAGAALNFHLTKRERKNIREALYSEENTKSFNDFAGIEKLSRIRTLTQKAVSGDTLLAGQ